MKQKKIPMRNCKGCNEMTPKKELIRIVKSPEGEISLVLTVNKHGRGAYICHSVECFKKVRKSKRLEKEFECKIPEEVYDLMEKELTDDGE